MFDTFVYSDFEYCLCGTNAEAFIPAYDSFDTATLITPAAFTAALSFVPAAAIATAWRR